MVSGLLLLIGVVMIVRSRFVERACRWRINLKNIGYLLARLCGFALLSGC